MIKLIDELRYKAQAAADAEKAKAKGWLTDVRVWLRLNWPTLTLGAAVGYALCILVHRVF